MSASSIDAEGVKPVGVKLPTDGVASNVGAVASGSRTKLVSGMSGAGKVAFDAVAFQNIILISSMTVSSHVVTSLSNSAELVILLLSALVS